MSVRLAESLGLEADTIRRLIKGAFLHDVGKIGIPDEFAGREDEKLREQLQSLVERYFMVDIAPYLKRKRKSKYISDFNRFRLRLKNDM